MKSLLKNLQKTQRKALSKAFFKRDPQVFLSKCLRVFGLVAYKGQDPAVNKKAVIP